MVSVFYRNQALCGSDNLMVVGVRLRYLVVVERYNVLAEVF